MGSTCRVDLVENPKQLLDDPCLSPREVASFLGVTIQTVYNLIRDREIQAAKIGQKFFIRTSEVQRLVERGVE
jgi:excisionase family DNA binding protein